jgi:oligoribonuclease
MTSLENNLVWLDLENTGLEIEKHHIIELAIVITDSRLDEITKPLSVSLHQPEEVLAQMSDWVRENISSGKLFEEVRESSIGEREAEKKAIEYISPFVEKGHAILCGNSIWNDRKFIEKYMPKLESWFHYRMVDVSSIKVLYKLWKDVDKPPVEKEELHRALPDIRESIAELKFYRENFLRIQN